LIYPLEFMNMVLAKELIFLANKFSEYLIKEHPDACIGVFYYVIFSFFADTVEFIILIIAFKRDVIYIYSRTFKNREKNSRNYDVQE